MYLTTFIDIYIKYTYTDDVFLLLIVLYRRTRIENTQDDNSLLEVITQYLVSGLLRLRTNVHWT